MTRSELANKLRYFYEDLATRVSSKTPLSQYFLDFWRPDIMQAIDAYEREPELLQRIEQLEAENRRLKATVEAAWKILCNRSCDECGEDLDDPANCMNCTMKHSLDVIPKLRKVLLAAPEEENKSE